MKFEVVQTLIMLTLHGNLQSSNLVLPDYEHILIAWIPAYYQWACNSETKKEFLTYLFVLS